MRLNESRALLSTHRLEPSSPPTQANGRKGQTLDLVQSAIVAQCYTNDGRQQTVHQNKAAVDFFSSVRDGNAMKRLKRLLLRVVRVGH